MHPLELPVFELVLNGEGEWTQTTVGVITVVPTLVPAASTPGDTLTFRPLEASQISSALAVGIALAIADSEAPRVVVVAAMWGNPGVVLRVVAIVPIFPPAGTMAPGGRLAVATLPANQAVVRAGSATSTRRLFPALAVLIALAIALVKVSRVVVVAPFERDGICCNATRIRR